MAYKKYIRRTFFISSLLGINFILLFGPEIISAQQQVALPTDGSVSIENAPQGANRYQRQLYLIRASEMADAGFVAGTEINSIGFTLAAAQDTSTIAAFDVYLENTMDDDSRIDTAWTQVPAASNSATLENLAPGDYEWQVRALCVPNSDFSASVEFSTRDLDQCLEPINLVENSITSSDVTLNWYTPTITNFVHYRVEYKSIIDPNWTSTTTTSPSITIGSLSPLTLYQWRVRTICASDSSDFNLGSFSTLNTNNCNPPASLAVTSTNDTSANLEWTAAVDAIRYDVRFRRLGTTFWLSTTAFTNSFNLTFGLDPGTTYEWGVRTVCVAGSGDFVSAGSNNIVTTGTAVCYTPTDLFVDNISDTTATLNWTTSVGAPSYAIRYRLKNAISWTNAIGPMTQVHNDSIVVPADIGNVVIPFSMGSSFTYNGGALYVAFEYANDTIALSSFNSALVTKANSGIVDQNGLDSAQLNLCLTNSDNTALPNYLFTTTTRPQTFFGSPSFVDSVAVDAVYALGYYALNYSDTTPITALVTNFANEARDYCVNLSVVEQNSNTQRYTETQCLTIDADTSVLVEFSGWIPGMEETNLIIVSIPAAGSENVVDNNTGVYVQQVNANTIAYDDGSDRINNAGFADSSGLILVRHKVSGCGQINSVDVYLDFSSVNHPVYAVVLDSAGAILDSSEIFTPTSENTSSYHTFHFPKTPYIGSNEFYVGLAQTETTSQPYFPVGVQYEGANIRSNSYYRDSIGGGNLTNTPLPGRLMIRANIGSGSNVPVIEGDLSLCLGDTNVLSIASATQRFAIEVLDVSSEVSNQDFSANQVLGPPNVYPAYEANSMAWVSATPDGQREYLELGFAGGAPINYIDIYETFNPGAVDTVYVKDDMGNFVMVYSNAASAEPDFARINKIEFPMTTFDVTHIRIALASDSVPGFHAIDAVAMGQRTSPGVFSSYLWSPNGETTNSIEVITAGIYSVMVTDGSGCENLAAVEVISPQQTVPVISVAIGEDTIFCDGGSVTLMSDQTSGNTWSTMETTQSITVQTAGSYTVSYDDGTGCGVAVSTPINVTVNPLPSPTITGLFGICPGGSTVLDAGAGFSSYSWSTGAVTQTITVSSATSVEVVVTDANGCAGSTTANTFINTPPSPAITGNLSFCPGSNTVLDAGAGYSSYLWSSGETTQTVSVSTATTVSVDVTDANGCSGSTSTTTSLYTPPSPSISGELDFCLGESTQLDAGSYSAYVWSTGETTAQIVASAAGSYDVTVTDGNGCQGSTGVSVTINIPPTPVITGSFSFCGGSSTTLDAGAGYNTYLWSTGAISQQITVLDTATYVVTVTDANGCVGVASATTTIEGSIPVSPDPISGPTDGLCNATNVFYSIDPVPNASFYVWTVPDSVDILSGQGTTEILVNVGNGFTSGDIVVAASNACGQSPSIDPTFLTIYTGSSAVDTILGPTSGPCNIGLVQYTVNGASGATSYNWTVPPGASIVSGQGTSTIDMIFSGSGEICVESVNSCGTSVPTCLHVALNDVIVDAGDCQLVVLDMSPFDCVEFTATVAGGGTAPYDYSWTDEDGMVVGTSRTLNVCPDESTYYMVTVMDANGCTTSDIADAIIIQANCGNNKVNVCHFANNRTRCLNANAALSHLGHGDKLGSCGSADPCDPSATESIEINTVAMTTEITSMDRVAAEDQSSETLSIFPNPASRSVVLAFNSVIDATIEIEFRDQLGRVVKSIDVEGQDEMEIDVDVSDLSAGMYFVSLKQDEKLITKSLIVQNN